MLFTQPRDHLFYHSVLPVLPDTTTQEAITTTTTPVTNTQTSATANIECLTEHDTGYSLKKASYPPIHEENDVGDWESCRSICKSQPNAPWFSYKNFDSTCSCKSKQYWKECTRKQGLTGVTSGETTCTCESIAWLFAALSRQGVKTLSRLLQFDVTRAGGLLP